MTYLFIFIEKFSGDVNTSSSNVYSSASCIDLRRCTTWGLKYWNILLCFRNLSPYGSRDSMPSQPILA